MFLKRKFGSPTLRHEPCLTVHHLPTGQLLRTCRRQCPVPNWSSHGLELEDVSQSQEPKVPSGSVFIFHVGSSAVNVSDTRRSELTACSAWFPNLVTRQWTGNSLPPLYPVKLFTDYPLLSPPHQSIVFRPYVSRVRCGSEMFPELTWPTFGWLRAEPKSLNAVGNRTLTFWSRYDWTLDHPRWSAPCGHCTETTWQENWLRQVSSPSILGGTQGQMFFPHS